MNKIRISIIAVLTVCLMASCRQEYTVFDNPYSYIVLDGDLLYGESSTIPSNVNNVVRTYNVYLSSKAFETPITISYDITVGDGLKEGVDFEIVSKERTLQFLPGIYSMPVRIKYLRNTLDKTKDNTITISLVSSSEARVNLGFPGDAHKCARHTITKFNI